MSNRSVIPRKPLQAATPDDFADNGQAQFTDYMVDDGVEDGFPAREIMVEGHRLKAQARAEFPGAERFEAVLVDERERSRDNGFAGKRRVRFLAQSVGRGP